MRNAPDALVTVHLLPSEQGGRRGPTPDKTYGCIMMIDGVNLDIRFRLDGVGPLQPGTTRDVGIDFLNPEAAKPHLRIGETFRLREASVIGNGTIKDIFIRQRRKPVSSRAIRAAG
jgi:hypothetical protein